MRTLVAWRCCLLGAVGLLTLGTTAVAETVYDSAHSAVVYSGTWNKETSSTYSRATAGTLSETRFAGSSAKLTFSGGKYVALVYTMGGNRWKSDVYIDGVYRETINARSPDGIHRWQVMKTWRLGTGSTHTIEVIAKGPVDGQWEHSTWSDVDAFIVDPDAALPGSTNLLDAYPYSSPRLTYAGSWYTVSTYEGNRKQSNVTWDAIRFTFYGDSVTWVYHAQPDGGIAHVTLDGQARPDIDLYGSGGWYPYTISGLAPGLHTLTIGVSGKKHPYSYNSFVNVQEFWVGR